MAMNLVRTGTSAAAGVASGVLSSPQIAPLELGGQIISWATIAEALALLGGAAMQFMAPFTAPNLADGLVDGGAALLAARATTWAMTQTQAGGNNAAALARRAANAAMLANRPMAAARGQIGSATRSPKYSNA